MSKDAFISVRGVSHSYDADRKALTDVNLDIARGVTGFIGPNGAGKTTLLRLLIGALRPTHGFVRIGGLEPSAYLRRTSIGYVGDTVYFDDFLTVGEFIGYMAALTGAPAKDELIPAELGGHRLGALSHGQARRVQIAAALTGGTEILLLDEPTNGLDPIAVRQLRGMIESLRERRMCIVFASHHLDEMERVADRFVLLAHGRILDIHSRDSVLAHYGSVDGMFAHYYEATT